MKKIAGLFLTFALLLAFAACSNGASFVQEPSRLPSNSTQGEGSAEGEVEKMYATIDGNRLEITLVENSSARALADILREEGEIVYTANDYGNFEKVGEIGRSLPRNDEQIEVRSGDVILYQGNSLCLYYGANRWNFTRIGRIEGYSEQELRVLLCAGRGAVRVALSLE